MDNLGNFLGNAAMSTSSYLSSKMKQPEFSRARESMNNAYQDAKSKYNTMKNRFTSSFYGNQNSMGGNRGTRRRKRCSVIRRRKNKICRTRRTRRKL
jgi:hypothetical protein